jgi:hypothetical protein
MFNVPQMCGSFQRGELSFELLNACFELQDVLCGGARQPNTLPKMHRAFRCGLALFAASFLEGSDLFGR